MTDLVTGKELHLAHLRILRRGQDEIEQRVAVLAEVAREEGATWTQIGDALGITKQAAQQRYGGKS